MMKSEEFVSQLSTFSSSPDADKSHSFIDIHNVVNFTTGLVHTLSPDLFFLSQSSS